jgi:type IV pilus assembly protein PilX
MNARQSLSLKNGRLDSERGLVLVTAMILLFVLTMVMVSAMQANVAQERMAGNSRDWNIAFQAAEAALRDAERDIMEVQRVSGITGFSTGCSSTGLCLPSSTSGIPIWVELANSSDPGWLTGSNTGTKTVKYGTYTNAAALSDVAAQPRYIIEALSLKNQNIVIGPPTFNYFYRVTAVGFGKSISTRVMLQGVYRQY